MDELAALVQYAHICHQFNVYRPPAVLRILLRELDVLEPRRRYAFRVADETHTKHMQPQVYWLGTRYARCVDALEITPLFLRPYLNHRSIAAFVVTLSKPELARNVLFAVFENQDTCLVDLDRTVYFL